MDVDLLVAALAGGAALFVWGAISWMVLPWHRTAYSAFTDEDAVRRAVAANAPAKGLYSLPKMECAPKGAPEAERRAARERAMSRMHEGPVVSAVVLPHGVGPMGGYMVRGFLIGVVSCLLVAWLLERTCVVGLVHRAGLVALIAFAGQFASRLSDWNWHGYPAKHTLVNLLDALVGWYLAGLAVAAVLPA